MEDAPRAPIQDAERDLSPMPGDPVLVQLYQKEVQYQDLLSRWQEQGAELTATQEASRELAQTLEEVGRQKEDHRREAEQLGQDVEALRRQLALERRQKDRQRERANQLADLLKDVHRALFSGNVYDLILKACLTITGGTRGLYITAQGKDAPLRIRAAVDVDGYPQDRPSEYIQALTRRALERSDTVVSSKEDDRLELPQPERDGERFCNFVAAPVVLLADLNGVVIVADKLHGDFEDEDVETLLSIGDQAGVAVENVRLRRELQRAYEATVTALADAMEAKDPYTQGHCDRVSQYARLTADKLELDEHDRAVVCYAALLHDVGKIGVSDGVLNKPGELLPEERELVRSHVRVGYDLLRHIPALETVADVVLHHHEWYDGSGYPEGLTGEEIPLAARILCAVDAYCAMITARSYKEAYTDEQARAELERCAGSQFDPRVVEALLQVLDMPEAEEMEDGEPACGILPGFGRIREYQQAVD